MLTAFPSNFTMAYNMIPTFKIKTVKWSWPEPVQSKEVYRDDELITTKTKEEALGAIHFLMNQSKGLQYTITVFRDGEYHTYWRHSMPCLGGLVKYKDSHGDRYFMNPYFPRDIRVMFPEGDIVYIACHRTNTKDIFKSPYFEFILSDESPWISAFGSKDTIIFEDNYFVLTNMNTDPTVFYSLMRLGGLYGNNQTMYSVKGWNPKAEILTKFTFGDPRRLAGQKPLKISGGTWAEGFGHTRCYNESIFHTTLPTKLADFGQFTAGYPQGNYKPTYFVSEMKEIFGITISENSGYYKPIGVDDKKTEDVLVKAWDYFKEKSKELSEYTDQAICSNGFKNMYK